MKKMLALLLELVMTAALLCACGTKNETTDTSSQSASSNTETNTEKKTLTMATNAYFKPYEYYDANNNIIGIDAEIAQAIADKLGMTLKIEDMQFNSILTSVSGGSVDFGMAGITVSETRKESVNFTNTYATGKQVIITTEGSAVKTPDDLAGKKIGVQLGTTGDIYCTDDYGKNEDGSSNGNVIEYNNGNEAVLALIGGAVQAVVIDNEPAKALVASNPGKNLVILDTEYVYEEYAICVKKDNTELLNQINAAIDDLVADGTIQKIIDKYIPAN